MRISPDCVCQLLQIYKFMKSWNLQDTVACLNMQGGAPQVMWMLVYNPMKTSSIYHLQNYGYKLVYNPINYRYITYKSYKP